MTTFGQDSWSFVPTDEAADIQQVPIAPRLIVNTVEAAVGSAVEGNGLTRAVLVSGRDEVRDGRLVVVLPEAESPALPVHLVTPEGRLSVPKVRTFVDFAVPRLKAEFARLADSDGAAKEKPAAADPTAGLGEASRNRNTGLEQNS